MKTRILVVDDEPTLLATLKYNLEREGYEVATAPDGETALAIARSDRPNLIVLDLMLPELSGFEVCRILRRESAAPILMLTAKSGDEDKVIGLELGADDYVTKPFSMRELLARVRALLRRAEPARDQADVLTSGDLQLDFRRMESRRDGTVLTLTPKEFELLSFLVRNRGKAFSREQLLDQVWGYEYAGDTRTVDVHISWLRQKIEEDPKKPSRIITMRGLGYRFEG